MQHKAGVSLAMLKDFQLRLYTFDSLKDNLNGTDYSGGYIVHIEYYRQKQNNICVPLVILISTEFEIL